MRIGAFIACDGRVPFFRWTKLGVQSKRPLNAIETDCGGPDAFKRFVKAAHERGLAVFVDVVHNHYGPTDLDLWRFDGWSENDSGGIYFYTDGRSHPPPAVSIRPHAAVKPLEDQAVLWMRDRTSLTIM